jgi:DNA-binding PadR family transcriptional regulator
MARRGETIELAVLGLLHEGPMHGYELRKRLNLMLGWGRVLSYGSLYPALKKMLRGALIEEVAASTTTPVTRRPRIVYQLTDHGRAEFRRLMSEVGPTAWEDDNFDIRFAFFGQTDMEIRLRVLEGRRTRLQERLDRVQSQLAMTQKEVDRYAAETSSMPRAPAPSRRPRSPSSLQRGRRSGGARRQRSDPGTRGTGRSDRGRKPDGFCSSSNRGGRQLRHLPDPGRRVLPQRRPERDRAGTDARHVR